MRSTGAWRGRLPPSGGASSWPRLSPRELGDDRASLWLVSRSRQPEVRRARRCTPWTAGPLSPWLWLDRLSAGSRARFFFCWSPAKNLDGKKNARIQQKTRNIPTRNPQGFQRRVLRNASGATTNAQHIFCHTRSGSFSTSSQRPAPHRPSILNPPPATRPPINLQITLPTCPSLSFNVVAVAVALCVIRAIRPIIRRVRSQRWW